MQLVSLCEVEELVDDVDFSKAEELRAEEIECNLQNTDILYLQIYLYT